jgi:hypothetical protein
MLCAYPRSGFSQLLYDGENFVPFIGVVMAKNFDNNPPGGGGDDDPPPENSTPGAPKPKRQFGALRGKISIGPEFVEPLPPDEIELWCQ